MANNKPQNIPDTSFATFNNTSHNTEFNAQKEDMLHVLFGVKLKRNSLEVIAAKMKFVSAISPDLYAVEKVENNDGYAWMLFQLVETLIGQQTQSLLALDLAITFKNLVERNWKKIPNEPSTISDDERKKIKQHVVELMLRSPEPHQKQLKEAISIIQRDDIPDEWPTLMEE